MKFANSKQTSSHNQQLQELSLKLPSNSSHQIKSFKLMIDEVQKKQKQARIIKHHSRLLKNRQIQQRFSKMKILSKNQQEQIKTNQSSKPNKNISDCYISLKIEMNKISDRTDFCIKQESSQTDVILPYLKHIDTVDKKRQDAVLRGCSNKWKVILNQQEKNINLVGSRTLRLASPKEGQCSKEKVLKLQREARKTDQFNISTEKRKKTIKGQFNHLKKKFFVMNQENIENPSTSSK